MMQCNTNISSCESAAVGKQTAFLTQRVGFAHPQSLCDAGSAVRFRQLWSENEPWLTNYPLSLKLTEVPLLL